MCTVITPAIGPFNRAPMRRPCDGTHNKLLDTRRLANGNRRAELCERCFSCD